MKDLRPIVGKPHPHKLSRNDATSIAVLKSDLLLLQKRIDVMNTGRSILSHNMQQQERLLFSVSAGDDGTNESQVKAKLLEAVLQKVREISATILNFSGKSSNTSNLLPYIDSKVFSTPSGTTNCWDNSSLSAESVPAVPLANPLGPTTAVGRQSFVDTFINLTDLLSSILIEDFGKGLETINVEYERRRLMEEQQNKHKHEMERLKLECDNRIASIKHDHIKEVEELKKLLEESKEAISESKGNKDKKSAPAKDMSKENRELSEEVKKLHDELMSVQNELKLLHTSCAESELLALQGLVGPKFLSSHPNLNIDVELPQVTLTRTPSDTADRPITGVRHSIKGKPGETPSATPSGAGNKKKGQQSEQELAVERQKAQVEALTAAIGKQNKILLAIQAQVPKIVEQRDSEIQKLQQELKRTQQQLKISLEDKDNMSLQSRKALLDKQAEITLLKSQINSLNAAQIIEQEELAADQKLISSLPLVTTSKCLPPASLHQKLKGQQQVMNKMDQRLTDLQQQTYNSQRLIQNLQEESEKLQIERQDLKAHTSALKRQRAQLEYELEEKIRELEDTRRRFESTNERLNTATEKSGASFERVKRLELDLDKANHNIQNLTSKTNSQQILLEGMEQQKQSALDAQRNQFEIEIKKIKLSLMETERSLQETEDKLTRTKNALQDSRADLNNAILQAHSLADSAITLLGLQFTIINPLSKVHNWLEPQQQLQKLGTTISELMTDCDERWQSSLRVLDNERLYLLSIVEERTGKHN